MVASNVSPNLIKGVSSQAMTAEPRSALTAKLDFTGVNAAYAIDVSNQINNQVFSSMRTIFVNNVNNPNRVDFVFEVTGQPLSIAPYSMGYYKVVNADQNGRFSAVSVGGATDLTYIAILNFDVAPLVTIVAPAGTGTPITAADGSIQTLGSKADAAVTNPAVAASLISLTKGVLTKLAGIPAALGQLVMANSMSVAIASDQSAIPVNTTPVYLNQRTMANSAPVVIASDQSAIPVSSTDGALSSVGAKADAAVTNSANPASVIAALKGLLFLISNGIGLNSRTAGQGLSMWRIASGTGGNIKSSAGRVYAYDFENTNAAKRYLQIYDKATAPVIGSDTPVYTVAIPPTSSRSFELGSIGIYCNSGIGW